jgi:hypothetical protein
MFAKYEREQQPNAITHNIRWEIKKIAMEMVTYLIRNVSLVLELYYAEDKPKFPVLEHLKSPCIKLKDATVLTNS